MGVLFPVVLTLLIYLGLLLLAVVYFICIVTAITGTVMPSHHPGSIPSHHPGSIPSHHPGSIPSHHPGSIPSHPSSGFPPRHHRGVEPVQNQTHVPSGNFWETVMVCNLGMSCLLKEVDEIYYLTPLLSLFSAFSGHESAGEWRVSSE